MPKEPGFRSAVVELWFRLVSLAIVGLVFALTLFLPHRIQGWTFYLTGQEVVFEIAVRVIFAALAGVALGTATTLLLTPGLRYFPSRRARLVEWTTNVAVVLVVFLDSRLAVVSLIQWANRGVRFTGVLLMVHFLFFVFALFIPVLRRQLFTSLDGFLGARTTRTMALMTMIATAGLVVTEFAFSKFAPTVKAAASRHPRANVLLITFDAFSADEMSLYGYRLPLTPNIDAFARNATVFTNFYAASSSTTPCIGVMLTGGYSSETRVYGLAGQVPAENAEKNFPAIMRTSGYSTGAFLTNPWAYYLTKSLRNGFDVLPEPTFHAGTMQYLWEATRPLHQDSRIGSRIVEYFDLEILWNALQGLHESLTFRWRPDATFHYAKQLLDQLADGYFLWVHVIAPHHPYLPDPPDQGRFIAEAELRTFTDEPWSLWKPHYGPDVQSQVDRRRMAYDEYILSTDRAFGAFMAELKKSGRLENTTVVVSADHGESFEGGIYQHETADLTRPVIHIPLIIKTPGQQDGRRVFFTVDQTALAPTILDLAGLPIPDWMHGQSLVAWLNREENGQGEGLAFTQYVERNSIFRPLHRGSIGVIDGEYQYVFYLDTQKGVLRPLKQAQIWDLDESSENPARVEALHAAIHAKFPDAVPAK